jgi:hypothetical protein
MHADHKLKSSHWTNIRKVPWECVTLEVYLGPPFFDKFRSGGHQNASAHKIEIFATGVEDHSASFVNNHSSCGNVPAMDSAVLVNIRLASGDKGQINSSRTFKFSNIIIIELIQILLPCCPKIAMNIVYLMIVSCELWGGWMQNSPPVLPRRPLHPEPRPPKLPWLVLILCI